MVIVKSKDYDDMNLEYDVYIDSDYFIHIK